MQHEDDVERTELIFEYQPASGKMDLIIRYESPPHWSHARHQQWHKRKILEVRRQLEDMGFPEAFLGHLEFVQVSEESILAGEAGGGLRVSSSVVETELS